MYCCWLLITLKYSVHSVCLSPLRVFSVSLPPLERGGVMQVRVVVVVVPCDGGGGEGTFRGVSSGVLGVSRCFGGVAGVSRRLFGVNGGCDVCGASFSFPGVTAASCVLPAGQGGAVVHVRGPGSGRCAWKSKFQARESWANTSWSSLWAVDRFKRRSGFPAPNVKRRTPRPGALRGPGRRGAGSGALRRCAGVTPCSTHGRPMLERATGQCRAGTPLE